MKKPADKTPKRGAVAAATSPAKRTRQPGARLVSPNRFAILRHARAAKEAAEQVKVTAAGAIRDAHEAGRLLISEKVWLLDIRNRAREAANNARASGVPADPGAVRHKDLTWQIWYDSNYATAIPEELAERFIRLARHHEEQTVFSFDRAPNLMRSGLLALALYPAKQHDIVEGDVILPKAASHLVVVNRFCDWLAKWRRRLPVGGLSLNERARLLTDFDPIARFIDELRDPKRIP